MAEYIIPEELKRFDKSITRKQTYDAAETAVALSRLLGGDGIDAIHPTINNGFVPCQEETDQDIFFPNFPEAETEEEEQSEEFIKQTHKAFVDRLKAKEKCSECPGQEQCLIWILLTENSVKEAQKITRPNDSERVDPCNGVTGGWGEYARKRILNKYETLIDAGVEPAPENNERAQNILGAARAGVPLDIYMEMQESSVSYPFSIREAA